jgi:hypothetical protein
LELSSRTEGTLLDIAALSRDRPGWIFSWKSAHRIHRRFGFKESANDYLSIMPTMEIDVDLYLAGMANDSARWKRLGRFGTLSFVEGLLDGLTGVGAITRDEAAA